jgi:hypothetical protein
MKKFFAVPLAVLFVAACSDSSTAPASSTADLTPSYAKPVKPPVNNGCTTCPVDGTYDFEGGVVVASGGTNVFTALQPDLIGTASDPDVVIAPSGEKFLGRFENVRTMVVIGVPAGNPKYSLDFDFYAIGSWDGRGKQAQNGVFQANVFDLGYRCTLGTGTTTSIFKTTFSNQLTVQQDYPLAYLTGGNKAATGSFAQDALNYKSRPDLSNTPVFRSFGDVSYHLTSSGPNPCGTAAVEFTISTSNPTQQSVRDESWGVDNIHIKAGS